MLLDFEDIKSYDYGSLRYFWYAAAPMSIDKLKEAISIFGPVMVQTYGQAEAPMICTFFSAEDHIRALNKNDLSILGSCGKASPDIGIAVLSESGDLLPPGSKGEVAIKGRLLMNKYFNNVEATKSIRINGWQLTGDMGIFDKEGYLSLVDRKGDMIISGGFNVYPGEIEQLIWGIPAIKDCAVIGIPHEKWGEQVTAIIELKDNNKAPEELEIINLCKDQLGSVKAPKKVIIIDELPRSPVGKVLKKDLRAVFWKNEKRKI
jgi:acyl-CoA synthetase (AMP-forming)/AMP-acid ligase II